MILARNRFRSYNNVFAWIRFTSYNLRSHARPARSPSLATLAPSSFSFSSTSFPCSSPRSQSLAQLALSYLSLALARRPFRHCSPTYNFCPLQFHRSSSYPRSLPLARSFARMLALLALLARSARPFLFVTCSRSSPLTSPFTSRSLSLLQHRLGRSHSLAQLAPSYSSLALARRPLRSRSPLLLVACSRSYNMGFARNRFSTYNIVLARIRFTSYYLRCSFNMVLARNRFRSYNNVLARIRFTSYNLR